MKVQLDSVLLVDHFNGIERASKYLADSHAEAAVSVITGPRPRRTRNSLLSCVRVLIRHPVDQENSQP